MNIITFDEFFKKLIQREEFSKAYNAISARSEREVVRGFCANAFVRYGIHSNPENSEQYMENICKIVDSPRNKIRIGTIGLIEEAAHKSGEYLSRKGL